MASATSGREKTLTSNSLQGRHQLAMKSISSGLACLPGRSDRGRLIVHPGQGDVALGRQHVVGHGEEAQRRQGDAEPLAHAARTVVVEAEVNRAQRQAQGDHRQGAHEKERRAAGQLAQRGHDVLEVVERGREQGDAEDALDRVHPGAGARQRHRKIRPVPRTARRCRRRRSPAARSRRPRRASWRRRPGSPPAAGRCRARR